MKRTLLTVILSGLLIGQSVFAGGITKEFSARAEDKYSNLFTDRVLIPLGQSSLTIALATDANPSDISIWYGAGSRCGQFEISRVQYADADGVLLNASRNQFEGISHYRIQQPTRKLVVTLSTERIFGMVCDIYVQAANFVVPTNFTMLGRVSAACSTDSDCEYAVERIDGVSREAMGIAAADVTAHKIKAGKIYKLSGYVVPKPIDSTDPDVFKILTSQEVL